MIPIRSELDLAAARARAEIVRASWTRDERLRRTGLPPDIPRILWRLLSEGLYLHRACMPVRAERDGSPRRMRDSVAGTVRPL
jgi:hypothetical protein